MRVIRIIKIIKIIRARRKIRVMKKILLNILLSIIDCNSILCQALQYIIYHLVEPVKPIYELV